MDYQVRVTETETWTCAGLTAPTPEELVELVLDALTFRADEPDLDLVAAEAETQVVVSLPGRRLCEARRWWVIGWLAPGACQDLDGCGLANWGSSQPGGWSVCDGDGQVDGRRELASRIEATLECLGDSLSEEHRARWVAAVTPDRVWSEISRWDMGRPAAPDGLDVWHALDDLDPEVPVRVGVINGTPLAAVQHASGEADFAWHPAERELRALCAQVGVEDEALVESIHQTLVSAVAAYERNAR